jgi:signal transduction histidine kinase
VTLRGVIAAVKIESDVLSDQLHSESSALGPAMPAAGWEVLHALSRARDSDLQEIVDLVQHLCEVEYAAISILAGQKYHLLVTSGIEPFTCGAEETLCAHTMDSHDTVVFTEPRQDVRLASSPYVDGTVLALRFYASAPIYAPDGTMVGRLCLFDERPRSLTPLQLRTIRTMADSVTAVLELRMRRSHDAEVERASLAATDEALGMAARISHDLRIPLTALTTSLEMLAETSSGHGATSSRVLESAQRSARRLTRMVDGLLELHGVGRVPRLTEVDLQAVAEQVLAEVDGLLKQAGAHVAAEQLPRVRADADQMYSVLLNLVGNAVKFARPGVPPVVHLTARPLPGCWRVAVTDNGVGIPRERRAEVFSVFSRLDPRVEGSGIGLATVARIVTAHGGRVGIADGSGAGTEVWFELPASPPEPS